MIAVIAVAIPAMILTWITVLVLLTFSGKSRKVLVLERRKITADITGLAIKIYLRKSSVFAAVCAVVGYVLLVRTTAENG
ncbi:hypothetical protein MKX01_031204 [Papaver californicum]|nr:hypothetical protein MKX01_031204 [Papaver californicum]